MEDRTSRPSAATLRRCAGSKGRVPWRSQRLRLECLEPRNLLANAPVGYWSFDNSGADLSGGNHPAVLSGAGATFSTTVRPGTGGTHSLSFNGAANNFALVNPFDVSEAAATIAFWFKANASGKGMFSVAQGNLGGGANDRNVYMNTTNIAATLRTSSFPSGEIISSTGKNYNDTLWHHVAFAYGPGVPQRLYVDGTLVVNGIGTSSILTAQDRIYVGFANQPPGSTNDWFNGLIDEVAVWDQVLTVTQIQALAAGTSPLNLPRPGLAARWNADSLALADDSVIGNWPATFGGQAAVASGQPTLQTSELVGHSVVRFAAADGIDTFRVAAANNPMSGANDFSLAVVFGTSTIGTGGAGTWTENTGIIDGSLNGETADWGLAINGAGQLGAGMGDPALTTYSSSGYANGNAHAAIYTRQGGASTLYIDGGDGITGDNSTAARSAADMVFGALQTGVNPFTGDIAEIQVFSLALAAADAQDLAVELGNRYELDITPPTPPGPPALVGHWVADDLAAGAVSSWNSRVGAVAATLGESDPARLANQLNGHAVVQLDGNDSLLVSAADNPLPGAGDFTVVAVIRASAVGSAGANWWENAGIVDADVPGNAADWGLALDANGRIGAGLGSAAGNNVSLYSTRIGLANSQPHVVAYTRSGGTVRAFVDGTAAGSAASGSLASRLAGGVAFGRIQSGGHYLTGDLAEVRMYEGALASDAVTSLTNELMTTYGIVLPIVTAGELLVDLRASDPSAATATWTNRGSLGSFARIGNPPVQSILGVTAVALNFDHPTGGWDDAFQGPQAPPTLIGSDNRSIEVWAYNPADGLQQAEETAVAWGHRGGPGGTNLTFGYGNSGTWGAVGHWDTPDMPWFVGGGSPTLGQWHHLVYTYDGSIARVYADGVQTYSEAVGTLSTWPGTINLGTQNGGGGLLSLTEGQAGSLALANVRVHSGVLSAADVLANYYAGIQLATTPPQAVADGYDVDEGELLTLAAPGVLQNDQNPSGLPLTAILDAPPQHGALNLAADGSFSYDSAANFAGSDSFTYHARSGGADSAVVTVAITVHGVYDPAVAVADSFVVATGQLFSVPAGGVLANDMNNDSLPLTALLDDDVDHGTLDLETDGSFTYQPQPGYVGPDGFTYHVFDTVGNSNVVAVNLLVDTPPQADNDSYQVNEDNVLSVSASVGVLNGDSDAELNQLTAVLVSAPLHGVMVLNPSGSFVYTPANNYFGSDSFTYRANDGDQLSNLGSVSIDVTAVNDAPVAIPDTYFGFQGDPISRSAATGLLANDSDVDSPALTAVLVAGPVTGSVDLHPDGSFSFQPPAAFLGTVQFTYKARDTQLDSSTVTVTIVINSRDQQIVINEINYDPPDNTLRAEFIELYNAGTTPVDLSSWFFSDGVDYTFSAGTAMQPGSYLLVGEDPATLADEYGVTALGPWTGALTNDGEDVVLRSALGDEVDFVDYGVGYPWPTSASGEGGSIELIHPSLDNQLGGSWRTSTGSPNLPPTAQSLLGAADSNWHYRKGTSEASTPMDAWRPSGFGEDATWLSGRTPIGYGDNDDNTPLTDMLGAYSTVYLRHEFTVGGAVPEVLKLRVYVDDGAIVWVNGHEVGRWFVSAGDKAFNAVTGVTDHEASWVEYLWNDAAAYLVPGVNTIAVHAINQAIGSSDLSIDAELIIPGAGDLPALPTPGARNSVYSQNAPPQTRQVDHSPQAPLTGQAETVTVRVSDPEGVASVQLQYQVVLPGQYIPAFLPVPLATLQANPSTPRPSNPAYHDPANWTTLAMRDDGTGGDDVANDSIYTATIPGQTANRALVRYRIRVEDILGAAVTVPYADDDSLNFAYYVYDGVPEYNGHSVDTLTSLPVYSFLTRGEDWAQTLAWNGADQMPQGSPNLARFEYNWYGTMVYNGEVYDNISYRLRGANGRYLGGNSKRSMKFNFNVGNYFQAYDENGDPYPRRWSILTTGKGFDNRLTLTYALNEQLNYYLYNQLGVPAPGSQFFHFRVVDQVEEAPDLYHGDFWGLNWAQENYDVRFLEAHGLDKGTIYKLINSANDPALEIRYQGPGAVTDGSDYWNIEYNLTGFSSTAFIQNHVQLDEWYLYHALAEAIRHYDYWPSANKNATWYFDDDYTPENNFLGQLWSLPWDTDATWGPTWNNGQDVVYNALFPSGDAGGDAGSHPELWPEYYNVVRALRDLMWQPDQINQLIDHFAAKIAPFIDADRVNAPADAGNYSGVGGVGKTSLAAYVQDMKNFAFSGGSWPGGDVGVGGRAAFLDTLQGANGEGSQIPNTPTISYAGAANYPADGLTFQTTPFADPQGAGTFGAMEWRLATYTNRTSPNYDPNEPFKLEYTADWQSGPIATFSNTINVPATGLEVGDTYRARVRVQDNTGRWSHWSAPVEFTVTLPISGQNVRDYLRITEVMYHPAAPTAAEQNAGFIDRDLFEYLELKNTSPTVTLELTGVHFANGVEFDFTGGAVTSLAPGQHVLIVRSAAAMTARYGAGLSIAGSFLNDSGLSNGGERIELADPNGVAILDFTFDDVDPWYPTTDGQGPSLVIVNETAAASTWSDPASWRASYQSGGSPGTDDVLPASVVGRFIFYNNSGWDGNSAAANPADDGAIATNKVALLPGQTATLANYTSFNKGINGVMIDVANLTGTPTAANFGFRTGNASDTTTWTVLAAAPNVSIRPGDGTAGSTRVTLTWTDGTIAKRWLQVTMPAGAATGLASSDVFYFGNAVGEAGNSAIDAQVNAADELGARGNPRNIANLAPITFLYDYNRDKQVNAADQLISRGNPTNLATRLLLITPTASPALLDEPAVAPAPAAAGLADAALIAFDDADDALRFRTRKR